MKAKSASVIAAIFICLLVNLPATSAASRRESIQNLQWNSPADGLQMSLSADVTRNGEPHALQLAFGNVGDHDVTLNLGSMLANGKVQLPDRISLTFIRSI